MPEPTDRQSPDIMQLWRQWLTESERQFNAFASEAMGNESFARALGSYMETYATIQRMLAEGMQRYLQFINVPSRTDVVGLGETLAGIEARLARIEETLQIAAEAVDAHERDVPASEPARTRRPPGLPPFDIDGRDGAAVPEELRR